MTSEGNGTGAAIDAAADDAEAVSEVMAELAEAEAAEAEARAEAARARAAAAKLRGDEAGAEVPAPAPPVRPRWRRGGWATVGLTVAAALICGLLTVTGVLVAQHRQVAAQRAHKAEFVAAAREAVVALLSIDHTHAKADVQRVIDLSTGTFRDDFSKGAADFVTTAEQSKAVTVGSISAAALESEHGDTGVVLLAASSQVTNSNGARQDPRAWRMSVTMTRDGGRLKMSNVEFVP